MTLAKTKITLKTALPYVFIVCGLIGLYCSFVLTQDKILLLEHPNQHLGCSIDPILACGSVISSSQGHAFGFPNPFLGLAGFAGLATIGLTILAGAKFKRWFWLVIEAGLLFALGFCHWLMFQTIFRINSLCIYCMVVWVITITSFWYATLYNIDAKHIVLPKKLSAKVYPWIRRHHIDIQILWILIIFAVILKHFWYYYGKKLGFN